VYNCVDLAHVSNEALRVLRHRFYKAS
jgi:hypothetical protein